MKFKAQEGLIRRGRKDKGLLKPGIFKVKIFTVKKVFKYNKNYKDPTPQVEIGFLEEKEKKFINHWYSLKGYERTREGDYIIKDATRIENPNKTLYAKTFIRMLFKHAGIDDPNIDPENLGDLLKLKGKHVRISVVENKYRKIPVAVDYTMPAEELADRDAEIERQEKYKIIGILCKKILAGKPENLHKYWSKNNIDELLDELLDKSIDELKNLEKIYGLTFISRPYYDQEEDDYKGKDND